MLILIYIFVFIVVGIVIALADKEKKFGLWVIVAISVLWGFVFGPWAIATFIELLIGYYIVNHRCFDKEKAIDFCGKSDELLQDEDANPDAQYMLGKMYENNHKNRDSDNINPDCPDIIMAIECYLVAAQQGHVEAQYKYGELYPIMRPNDHAESNRWLLKAAEQGHAEAQYSWALRINDPEKSYWLYKAAKQGHLESRELLGEEIPLMEDDRWIDYVRRLIIPNTDEFLFSKTEEELLKIEELIVRHASRSIRYLRRLPNLKFLVMQGSNLKKLPAEIGELHQITILDLSINELTELPKEIGNMVNLEELICHNNKLEQLPVEIQKLKELKELSVSANHLEELPEEIWSMSQLESLAISCNSFKLLPSSICKLSNLKKLIIHSNPLTTLPDDIIHLTGLKRFHYGENVILNDSQKTWIKTLKNNGCEVLPEEIEEIKE